MIETARGGGPADFGGNLVGRPRQVQPSSTRLQQTLHRDDPSGGGTHDVIR